MTNANNPILAETVQLIEQKLGSELDTITVARAVLGLFFSGVKLSSGQGGLCFTPIKSIPEAVCCPSSAKAMPLSSKLGGLPARAYIEYVFGDNILKKTLGIATLNALSAACWERMPNKGYSLMMNIDAFDAAKIRPGEKAVVVGALVPVIRQLLQKEIDFKILELDPATLKPQELEHYAPAADAHLYVPDADLLVITGTTLINDTLPGLLELAKPGARIIVTGPTASMLPDAFFSRGVTALGSILVTRPDELLDVISQAGSGYHFFGKSADRMLICK